MDSMRSLNTSLPKTRRQPDVHQAFRTAALNVTNLYKSALADLDKARADGYQEALEDLLAFLDKENIGVATGDAWRIRQWTTERLDGSLRNKQSGSESEEDDLDDKRARSSSPVMERNLNMEDTRTHDPLVEPVHRSDSAPPPLQMEASTTAPEMAPLHHVFQFSSPQAFPSGTNTDTTSDFNAAARRAFPTPRRTNNRSSTRNLQRSAAQNLFQLGNGAGQKRRLMQDFFNVDGFNDRRDGSSGGSKRGRMT